MSTSLASWVIDLPTPEAQVAMGERLASALPGAPMVVFLEGNLGAGKTTLVRGLLRGLGYRGHVRSPTYTLIEPYELGGRHYAHLDLYRLADPEELEYLGLRDLLERNDLLLVEWPERGAGALPAADVRVHIEFAGDGRRLTMLGQSEAGQELVSRLAAQSS